MSGNQEIIPQILSKLTSSDMVLITLIIAIVIIAILWVFVYKTRWKVIWRVKFLWFDAEMEDSK